MRCESFSKIPTNPLLKSGELLCLKEGSPLFKGGGEHSERGIFEQPKNFHTALISLHPLSSCDHVWIIDDFKKIEKTYYDDVVYPVLKLYFPCENISIIKDDRGKPQLDGKSLELSISHSNDLLVIAVSSKNIGVDVEFLMERKFSKRIAARYFTPAENALDALDFYRSWTAREAFMKALGTGLNKDMKNIVVKPLGKDMVIGFHDHFTHQVSFFTAKEGYLLACCRPIDAVNQINQKSQTTK